MTSLSKNLKRIISIVIAITLTLSCFTTFPVFAQDTNTENESTQLKPEDLTFRKVWRHRNSLNTGITIDEMDWQRVLSSGNSKIKRNVTEKNELLVKNMSNARQTDRILLGDHAPYGAYDIEITEMPEYGSAGLELYKDDDNRILITQSNNANSGNGEYEGDLKIEAYVGGTLAMEKTLRSGEYSLPFTLKADFAVESLATSNTSFLAVWVVEHGDGELLDYAIELPVDFTKPSVVEEYDAYLYNELSAGDSSSFGLFEHFLTGGASQADPKVLHNQKGEVLREGDNIWVAMTTRGYHMNSNYQSIYKLSMKTGELQLAGMVAFNLDGRGEYSSYHAADFIYNEMTGEWIVMTTAHVEDPHTIKTGILPQDPRTTAFQFVDVAQVNYPNPSNEEDATLIYDEDAGKWRLAMCTSAGMMAYHIVLFESDTWNGTYTEIARYTQPSCTGIQIQKIDGKYYVFTGRSYLFSGLHDNSEAIEYPTLTNAVKLNIESSPRSYNYWAVMIPLEDEELGITRYYMLSFDRELHAAAHSYGSLYMYEAEQYVGMEEKSPKETVEDIEPIQGGVITTAQQLNQIRNDLSGNYTLGCDIDLSDVQNWTPIGDKENPFTGKLNGNGYTICNLNIDRTNDTNVGLFGRTASTSEITNLKLQNVAVNGRIYTAAVVGYNQGVIKDCYVNGKVTSYAAAGLIAGLNMGKVLSCRTKGEVCSAGSDSVGGLVGTNSANIGTIDLDHLDNKGVIENSSSNAAVTGYMNVGGLVGQNDCGIIKNSHADGDVLGVSFVGGLVGHAGANFYSISYSDPNKTTITPSMKYCYSTSNVSGSYSIGGLAGHNDGLVEQCFSTGNVDGEKNVGGLVGFNNNKGNVQYSFATCSVEGEQEVGSVLGWNSGSFSNIGSTGKTGHIGNSRFFTTGGIAPDFKHASTYSSIGVLGGYDNSIWSINANDHPSLAVDAIQDSITKFSLNQLLASVGTLNENDYTVESWNALQNVVENAEILVNAAVSTQAEIEAVYEELQAAIENLQVKPVSHTVTFDADNGTAATMQTVEDGSKATRPSPDPEMTGYVFKGWYIDGAADSFDFTNTPITADITLKAKWEEAVTPVVPTVTLKTKSISLYVGNTFKVEVKSIVPSTDTVAFKSKNTDVATVDSTSGTVSAKKAGTATITATTSSGATQTCEVTVKKPTITLKTGKKTLQVRDSFTVSVKLKAPSSEKVIFTSNRPKVATVNKVTGRVTAKAAGTAIITAKTTNGGTATCKITVKKPSITVKGKKTVKVGNSLSLKATVKGVRGTVIWSVNKKKLAGINRKTGKLTAKAKGTVKVTAKVGKVKGRITVKIK